MNITARNLSLRPKLLPSQISPPYSLRIVRIFWECRSRNFQCWAPRKMCLTPFLPGFITQKESDRITSRSCFVTFDCFTYRVTFCAMMSWQMNWSKAMNLDVVYKAISIFDSKNFENLTDNLHYTPRKVFETPVLITNNQKYFFLVKIASIL